MQMREVMTQQSQTLHAERIIVRTARGDSETYTNANFYECSHGHLEISWETEAGTRFDVYYPAALKKVSYYGVSKTKEESE